MRDPPYLNSHLWLDKLMVVYQQLDLPLLHQLRKKMMISWQFYQKEIMRKAWILLQGPVKAANSKLSPRLRMGGIRETFLLEKWCHKRWCMTNYATGMTYLCIPLCCKIMVNTGHSLAIEWTFWFFDFDAVVMRPIWKSNDKDIVNVIVPGGMNKAVTCYRGTIRSGVIISNSHM